MIAAVLAAAGTVYVGGRLARSLWRVGRAPLIEPRPPVAQSPAEASTPPTTLRARLERLNPLSRDADAEAVDPEDRHTVRPAGERDIEDWRLDGSLLLSSKALVALGVGAALHVPLAITGLVVVPVLGVVVVGFVGRAVADWRADQKIGVATADVASSVGSLASGHLWGLTGFMLVLHGTRKIARRNEDRTRRMVGGLLDEMSPTAWVVRDGVELEVPLDTVEVDDEVVVAAGLLVPVDGEVLTGHARLDQQGLTGESAPVEVGPGDAVLAATMVVEGRLHIRATRTGAETRAAQIEVLLDEATSYKQRFRAEGDDVVDIGARASLVAAALAVLVRGPAAGLAVIWAPLSYAMRYTAPVSIMGYMQRAAIGRVLIKDGRALELLDGVDVVVFDKTGTLTHTVPRVDQVVGHGAWSADAMLRLAAAAERQQAHPIALAIRGAAERRQIETPPLDDVQLEQGKGLRARVEGHTVRVGSARLLAADGIDVPSLDAPRAARAAGDTVVWVAVDDAVAGWIALQPALRPEAAAVVSRLRTRGLEVHLVSGDNPTATRRVADDLGITTWRAETLPDEKAAYVQRLQAAGRRVCFVGDGLNDAVALERADVSVSLASGARLSGDLASVLLLDDRLDGLDLLWSLGDEVHADMRRMTLWTLVPNTINIGGVFLFATGFSTAFMLFQLGLWSSMAVAAKPILAARAADREAAEREAAEIADGAQALEHPPSSPA